MGTCYSSKAPQGTDTYASDMANNPQPHPSSYHSGPYSRPTNFGFRKGGGPRHSKAPQNSNEQISGPPDERAALLTIQNNGDSGTGADSTHANNSKNTSSSRFGFKPNQDQRIRKSDSNSNLTNGSADSKNSTSQPRKNNVSSGGKKIGVYTASELVNGEPGRTDVWPYIDDEDRGSRGSVSSGKENDHKNDNDTPTNGTMNGNHLADNSGTSQDIGFKASQNGDDPRKANVANKIPVPGSKLPSRLRGPAASSSITEKKTKPEQKFPVTVSNTGAGSVAKKTSKGGTFTSRLGGLMPTRGRRPTPPRGVQFKNANEAKKTNGVHANQNGEAKNPKTEAPLASFDSLSLSSATRTPNASTVSSPSEELPPCAPIACFDSMSTLQASTLSSPSEELPPSMIGVVKAPVQVPESLPGLVSPTWAKDSLDLPSPGEDPSSLSSAPHVSDNVETNSISSLNSDDLMLETDIAFDDDVYGSSLEHSSGLSEYRPRLKSGDSLDLQRSTSGRELPMKKTVSGKQSEGIPIPAHKGNFGKRTPKSSPLDKGSPLNELSSLMGDSRSGVQRRHAKLKGGARPASFPGLGQSKQNSQDQKEGTSKDIGKPPAGPSPLKPPRQRSSTGESEQVAMDGFTYRHLLQDATGLKTMLLKLKRVIQEDECNSFNQSLNKNGFKFGGSQPGSPLARKDSDKNPFSFAEKPGQGTPSVNEIVQENEELRQQVASLQQQLEDQERTIKLLQHQMTKYECGHLGPGGKVYANAATQTDKARLPVPKSLLRTDLVKDTGGGTGVIRYRNDFSSSASKPVVKTSSQEKMDLTKENQVVGNMALKKEETKVKKKEPQKDKSVKQDISQPEKKERTLKYSKQADGKRLMFSKQWRAKSSTDTTRNTKKS